MLRIMKETSHCPCTISHEGEHALKWPFSERSKLTSASLSQVGVEKLLWSSCFCRVEISVHVLFTLCVWGTNLLQIWLAWGDLFHTYFGSSVVFAVCLLACSF